MGVFVVRACECECLFFILFVCESLRVSFVCHAVLEPSNYFTLSFCAPCGLDQILNEVLYNMGLPQCSLDSGRIVPPIYIQSKVSFLVTFQSVRMSLDCRKETWRSN